MKKKTPETINDEKALKKSAKKSLRTMRKLQNHHVVREKSRIIKYGARGFARNFWLSTASAIVMSLTLIILFVTVVASVILSNTADVMRDKIDITIYFKPGTSERNLEKLTTIISADSNIKSVETSTSEQEYEKLVAENAGEQGILDILDDEMKSILINEQLQSTMRIKVYNIENLDSIKAIVKEDETFQKFLDEEELPTYDVNQSEIATITSWANIARGAGIVLGVIFLTVSILVIFSTVRMAIFSRREEIYMMKLVGADRGFIRGPFVVEAEICGLIAGIISAIASYFIFEMLAPNLKSYGISIENIVDVLESSKLVLVFLVFIAAGVVIGRVSARLAISRYMHKA